MAKESSSSSSFPLPKSNESDNNNVTEIAQFLDSSHGITAAMYGGRRCPELKSLWRTYLFQNEKKNLTHATQEKKTSKLSIPDVNLWKSNGKKSINNNTRNLRRRTSSHLPRRHSRFPDGVVQKSEILKRKWKTKRRADNNKSKPSSDVSIVGPRRKRRKPNNLRKLHTNYFEENTNTSSYWLHTHLWMAKRFHMLPNFHGWCVPLMHNDRGPSSVALRTTTLLQDATYLSAGRPHLEISFSLEWQPFILSGIISKICGPFPFSVLNDESSVKLLLEGRLMADCVLYKPSSYPSGALGPAKFMIFKDFSNINKSSLVFFVHPSLRQKVMEILVSLVSELMRENNTDIGDDQNDDSNSDSDQSTIKRDNNDLVYHPTNSNGNNDSDGDDERVFTLFKVRGKDAAQCIINSLSPKIMTSTEENDSSDESGEDNEVFYRPWTLSDYANMLKKAHHGSICEAIIKPLINDPSSSKHTRETNTDVDEADKWCKCFFVSVCPNHHNRNNNNQNYNTSGLDILIPISKNDYKHHHSHSTANQIAVTTTNLFLSLVHEGKARVIGLLEDITAKLEADPPIAVFPRDYPDTHEGKLYWSSIDSNSNPNTIKRWFMLRMLTEYPKERRHSYFKKVSRFIAEKEETQQKKTMTKKQSSLGLHFNHETVPDLCEKLNQIISDRNNTGAESQNKTEYSGLVVVRGEIHGKPFLQSLCNSAHVTPPNHHPQDQKMKNEKLQRTRPRRKVRNPNDSYPAYMFPRKSQEKEQHLSLCLSLLNSLSLQAILRCFVVVDGKGNLQPGATIIMNFDTPVAALCEDESSTNLKQLILGYIVAGSFSSTRGRCTAVGFVAANRLLEAIMIAAKSSSDTHLVVRNILHQSNSLLSSSNQKNDKSYFNKRQIELCVYVHNPISGSNPVKCSLSLLFS